MSMPQIHVILVSAQAAPNLLPALDPAMKPHKVIMLVSQKMRAQADALNLVFRENAIDTKQVELANEHDIKYLEETMMNLATQHPSEHVALNLTGGTKLMALAAQSIAGLAGWATFYVDVDTDEVIWIDGKRNNKKLTEQLRLRHYLLGYGFRIKGSIERLQPNVKYEQLISTLLLQIGSLESPLSQLNWLTQQAEDRRSLSVTMSENQSDSIGLQTLLRNFSDSGLLQIHGLTLQFSNEDDRNFVKGGWLEHHVYRIVEALTQQLGIRDKAVNLSIIKDGVSKEMDVIYMARNRPYVIECKTARMDKPEAPKANDALFKLTDVSRVLGLGANKMLASYRKLRDSEKDLAKALGIQVVCGEDLNHLKEKILKWA